MEATRCTQGIILAVLAMLGLAWFFDALPALLLAIFLAGFLVFRAVMFLRETGSMLSTVSLEREAKPEFLRQGGLAAVVTAIQLRIPCGMTATLTDLLPPGTQVVRGLYSAHDAGAEDHAVQIRYGISCLSSGNIRWRGLSLVVSDPFFSMTLSLQRHEHQLPVLHVDPVGRYQKREGMGLYGEKDMEKLSVLRGTSIRAFRDYMTGDDPRSIDWKLSAKHGRLFVREYSGLSGKHPLLVVDLPDGAVPCPPKLRDAVLGAALQAARDMTAGPQGCSLMIISGANLLSFLPEERSLPKIERALREYHSPSRVVQCFRTLDPVTAEALRVRLAADTGGQSGLGKRLLQIYTRFIPEMRPLPFDIQCARALGRRGESALHVLTTGTGDMSHLATLGLYARRMGIEASLGIPGTMANPELLQRLRGTGYGIVRVV